MLRLAILVSILFHCVLLFDQREMDMSSSGAGASRQKMMRVEISRLSGVEKIASSSIFPVSKRAGDGTVVQLKNQQRSALSNSSPLPAVVRSADKIRRKKVLRDDRPSGIESPASPETEGRSLSPERLTAYRLEIGRALRKIAGNALQISADGDGAIVMLRVTPYAGMGRFRVSIVVSSGDQGIDRLALAMIESAVALCPLPAALEGGSFDMHLLLGRHIDSNQ